MRSHSPESGSGAPARTSRRCTPSTHALQTVARIGVPATVFKGRGDRGTAGRAALPGQGAPSRQGLRPGPPQRPHGADLEHAGSPGRAAHRARRLPNDWASRPTPDRMQDNRCCTGPVRRGKSPAPSHRATHRDPGRAGPTSVSTGRTRPTFCGSPVKRGLRPVTLAGRRHHFRGHPQNARRLRRQLGPSHHFRPPPTTDVHQAATPGQRPGPPSARRASGTPPGRSALGRPRACASRWFPHRSAPTPGWRRAAAGSTRPRSRWRRARCGTPGRSPARGARW